MTLLLSAGSHAGNPRAPPGKLQLAAPGGGERALTVTPQGHTKSPPRANMEVSNGIPLPKTPQLWLARSI